MSLRTFRFFSNDRHDLWRFDGQTLEALSGSKWVPSIFTDPIELDTCLNHIKEVPNPANPTDEQETLSPRLHGDDDDLDALEHPVRPSEISSPPLPVVVGITAARPC